MKNGWIIYVIIFALIIILPLGTAYFFLFLKKIFQIPKSCKDFTDSAKELQKKYKKWDLLGGLLFVVFGFAGGYLGWWICHNLCLWHASDLAGEFVLFPKKGLCLTPSVPGGIAFGILATWISLKALLTQKEFAELECYSHLKLGFNTTKFTNSILGICAILAMIGVILPFNCYMILSEKGITYNPLFGFKEHSYEYSDIEKVTEHTFIKNRFKKDISVKIAFKDKKKWNSANTEELSNERAKRIANYISSHSGLNLEKIERKRRNLK